MSKQYEDIGYAKLDLDREQRTGKAEVVFCPGKTPEQVAGILKTLSQHTSMVIATKATAEQFEATESLFAGEDVLGKDRRLRYYDEAKIIAVNPVVMPDPIGMVSVVTGGTADIPIAEEAAVTCELYGHAVKRIYDVGVAGIGRLIDKTAEINAGDVIIAIAGMEGALPSVVAGLTDKPVLAVPSSVGYGASFEGLTALLAMLSGCSLGVAVFNIDNGFGAAYMASMIIGGQAK